jgi:hypothetical protein
MFVLVTLVLPKGIVGALASLRLARAAPAPKGEAESALRAENA